MIHITLGPADRERYGLADAPLEFDVAALTAREAGLVQSAGYDNPETWLRNLDGAPIVVDRHFVFETDPATGEQKLDEDGMPIPKVRTDFTAWRVLIWLAVRRAGRVDLALDDVDFAVPLMRWDVVEEPGGKAPSPKTSRRTQRT